jgi:trans-aconitate methyltransferase
VSTSFQPRFGHAVSAYVAYRPEFPAELFERILDAVPAERRRCAMDLGAGTGNSTRPLLPHFAEVIAVEPDPLLAEEFRASGLRAELRVATAENVVQDPASVDLITIAAALYWMDVSCVMANILRWLRPGGVLAVWAGGIPHMPDSVDSITAQEFTDRWHRFRDPRLDLAESSQHVRRAATGFTILDDRTVPHIVWLTAQEFVGFWRSTSYGSAYARELAVPEAYWRDLEARYRYCWPRERFPVDFSPWLVLARKD